MIPHILVHLASRLEHQQLISKSVEDSSEAMNSLIEPISLMIHQS